MTQKLGADESEKVEKTNSERVSWIAFTRKLSLLKRGFIRSWSEELQQITAEVSFEEKEEEDRLRDETKYY
jgi:hypothetical protein